MCREGQSHFIVAYIDIGVVIGFLCFSGDLIDEVDAPDEILEFKGALNRFGALRPLGDAFQIETDLFWSECRHGDGLFLGPTGPAEFAAARQFVDCGPGPRFRGFRAHTFLFIALFDVRRLTFLFVRVTRFIALGHGLFLKWWRPFFSLPVV